MTTRFRTLPLRQPVERIDRENRIIYGASITQAVEALGHGVELDTVTLTQVAELGNGSGKGVKSRFTHPGLSSDGLGKYLGRWRNLQVEGDKTVGDLHIGATAMKSTNGQGALGEYVMDLAEEDPEAFGVSIVFDIGDLVWTFADGHEESIFDGEGNKRKRPDDALTKLPVVRVKDLRAADVVDEPAANRDGMFSSALWGTNKWAEEVFGEIDTYVATSGIGPEKVFEVALSYAHSRGVDLKEFAMGKQFEEQPVEEQESTPVEGKEPQEEEAELQTANAKLSAQLAKAEERIAKMERESRRVRFRTKAEGWFGDPEKHVDVLERLGEDSDLFKFYVETNRAYTEQSKSSQLFEEMGNDREPAAAAKAWDEMQRRASSLAAEEGITLAAAISKVAEADPQLYNRYKNEGV